MAKGFTSSMMVTLLDEDNARVRTCRHQALGFTVTMPSQSMGEDDVLFVIDPRCRDCGISWEPYAVGAEHKRFLTKAQRQRIRDEAKERAGQRYGQWLGAAYRVLCRLVEGNKRNPSARTPGQWKHAEELIASLKAAAVLGDAAAQDIKKLGARNLTFNVPDFDELSEKGLEDEADG